MMMKIRAFHVILFACCLFTACTTQRAVLTPVQYKKWYSSDDFVWRTTDTVNKLIYSIAYVPGQVEIARCAIEKCKSKEELKKDQKELSQDFSFILQIQTMNWNQGVIDLARPELSRNEIMTYLNGQIKNDLCGLSEKDDTLKCTGIIYEPISNDRIRILFTIEGKGSLNNVVFKDRIFSGFTQNFQLPELSFNKTPILKF